MKVLGKIDDWWLSKSSSRRLDRSPANVGLTVGLLCPSAAITLRGPAPSSFVNLMPVSTQIAMCACIFVGLLLCLHGIMLGSRWYFPKTTVPKAYQKSITGAPLAFTGLMVYTYFLWKHTPDVWGTLNIFLTPALGFALAGQVLLYWLDIRRIRSNVAMLTESVKVRAKISDELSGDS